MRLDGGHPALDLINTVYGQVDGPVETDVLATPENFVTFARRVGMAADGTPADARALGLALTLRDALDAVLRAHLVGAAAPADALAALKAAAVAAQDAAALVSHEDGFAWSWDPNDAYTPAHRLAHAAVGLLTSQADMAILHCCDACRWLFLDRSRGAGRRWCSMADCGTEAKKRRYIQRRRERRAGQ